MRILLINPNRSAWITERVAAPARAVLLPNEILHTVTSAVGPEVVRTPSQASIATQEALILATQCGNQYDALIIGISLDCGLAEMRQKLCTKTVIGMTEAACLAACTYGTHFGVLTVGSVMQPLYMQHIQRIGLASRCVGVQAPDIEQVFASNGVLAEDVIDVLVRSAGKLHQQGAKSIVLAGAVLCGSASVIAQRTSIACFEGSACAVGLARMRLQHQQCFGINSTA